MGIGSNKLLAKLATKKAKPNGVHHLKVEDAQDFIQDLEVRELPGTYNPTFSYQLCVCAARHDKGPKVVGYFYVHLQALVGVLSQNCKTYSMLKLVKICCKFQCRI